MLDEMLDWFASPQNLGKKNEDFKKEGNIGKLCWMKCQAGLRRGLNTIYFNFEINNIGLNKTWFEVS